MEPKKLSRMFTETVETDLLAPLLQAWESSGFLIMVLPIVGWKLSPFF
jgi:hypothetical protein